MKNSFFEAEPISLHQIEEESSAEKTEEEFEVELQVLKPREERQVIVANRPRLKHPNTHYKTR